MRIVFQIRLPKVRLLASIFACCVVMLYGQVSLSYAQEQAQHTLQFAIAQAPLNLDPCYATDAASERVNRLLYTRLVEFDAASKPVAGIADWQMQTPQLYRFVLKPNLAHFPHGKALNAQDVKATYERLMQLKDSPHAAEFANVQSIQTPNANTIEFHLKSPDTHFASKLIIGILPSDLIAKGHDFSHQPVGNGTFKFVSWQHSLLIERVRDGLMVTFSEVKDPTVRVLKLMRGEADVLQGDLPPELVKYLQSKPNVTVKTSMGTNFSYLGLNMQDPILQSLKVRQALAYAIDRPAIIKQVMLANTRVADAILTPEHYAGNAHLAPYAYNPTLAKALLKEAGIRLPLKLVYKTSTDAQRVRLATIIQAQMAPAGIELEIRSLDWGTFFQDVKQGKFQLFGLTWVGIKTPEIYAKAFGSEYKPPNGFNRGHYQDAILDALMAKEDWPAVTQRVHVQLPYIPLWYEGQFAAYRQYVQGYQPQPDGNWDGLATVQLSPAH